MPEITIRMACAADVPAIMHIMTAAHQAMADPSAYITDDEAYVAAHVRGESFTLLAEADGVPAGFFLVCVPGLADNNLGRYLNFSKQQLLGVAMMDSAAVLPAFQGLGVMGQMFRRAVALAEPRYPYLLGTVAPDNTPSRRNFEKCGFFVLQTIKKPHGLTRLLMGKGTKFQKEG